MLSLFLQVCPLHLYCIGLLSPLHYFFLVYYRIFKLKRSKSKKTIHLPPKEEGVFLEILDKTVCDTVLFELNFNDIRLW